MKVVSDQLSIPIHHGAKSPLTIQLMQFFDLEDKFAAEDAVIVEIIEA